MVISHGTSIVSALPALPKLNAEAAVLMDGHSGFLLAYKNKDTKIFCPMANEMMTLFLAVEKGSFSSNVTISKNAANSYGPLLYLDAGEILSLEDLIGALMLRTAYDGLNAVAEHIGGTVENFVAMMNARALELGMKNTTFINPTGAYDPGNVSTAGDLALLLKKALANPSFKAMMSVQFKPLDRDTGVQLVVNQNQLLFTQSEEVTGGKCIISGPYSAVTLAEKNNLDLVSLVLRSNNDSVYFDSSTILKYGFDNFRRDILVRKGEKITDVDIDQQQVNLVAGETVYYVFPAGDIHISRIQFGLTPEIRLPLTKLTVAGIARYEFKDGTFMDVNLYPDKDYAAPRNLLSILWEKINANQDIFVLIIISLLLELIILTRKMIRRIRLRHH